MKNLKRLVAVALTVVMLCALSTVSFAAVNLDYSNEIEFSAVVSPATVAPGEDVTLTFYMKDKGADDSVELTDGGTFGFNFAIDTTKFTYKTVTLGQSFTKTFASKDVNGVTYYTNTLEAASTATVNKDEAIFTYVFTVNEGVENGTYDLITATQSGYCGDLVGYEAGDYSYNFGQVTVQGASQEEEVVATVLSQGKETVNGVNNSYWGVWVGRYSVSAGTKTLKKVVVTFNGDTRNNGAAKEYAKDGLSITGDGTVNFEVAILGVPDEFLTASKAVATLQ